MKISQVLYINLATRRDRFESIKEVLAKCPHQTQRIEAIRPCDEDLSKYQLPKHMQDFISPNGMVGCTLSHKRCIEYLLSQNLPKDEYSIVLEDDVKIHESLWDLLNIVDVEQDADIIFFDAHRKASYFGLHSLYSNTYPLTYKIHSGSSCAEHKPKIAMACFHGTHFIAYKNNKLQKMLDWFNNIEVYRSIDLQLILEKEFNRYFVETGLIYQDIKNLNSNINNKIGV